MRIDKQSDIGRAEAGRHGAGRKGLILIVPKEGRGRWAFRYVRRKTGKPTEMGLGSADEVTLADARDKAHELRKVVTSGGDPIEEKREKRRKKTTFGDMVDTYLGLMQPVWRSEKHASNMTHLLRNHASPLSSKAVAHITTDDIEMCLRPTWTKSPDMGRRTLAGISQVLDLAISYNHVERNPADWKLLRRRFPSRHKAKSHSAMPYKDVPRFAQQLHVEQQRNPEAISPFALEFLLLVACRVTEVTGMRWSEIDFTAAVWTVPATRMKKSDRPHQVPLSTRAMELLARQRELTRDSEYVWPGTRRNRPLNSKSLYLFLNRSMQLKYTLHGLRATFRTWAGEETNFSRVTCEHALAHVAGDQTEQAYNRGVELEKRRRLMQQWCDYCLGRLPTSA
jgi:integrase